MNENLDPKNYQDDLDTDKTDAFANEYGDQPAEDLQMPEAELKKELDNIALDEAEKDNDDMRETIEDADEADDNAATSR